MILPVDDVQIEALQKSDIGLKKSTSVHEEAAGRICCIPR
jgi:hypothetical protein